jgi:hypothetical protein
MHITFRGIIFGCGAHDFATDKTAGVGQHQDVRGDALPSATAGANDFDF